MLTRVIYVTEVQFFSVRGYRGGSKDGTLNLLRILVTYIAKLVHVKRLHWLVM